MKLLLLAGVVGFVSLLTSCATVSTERVKASYETADVAQPFPPYEGAPEGTDPDHPLWHP